MFLSLSTSAILTRMEKTRHDQSFSLLSKPTDWLINILAFQLDLIYNLFAAFVISPIVSLFSFATESCRRVEEAKRVVVSTIAHGTIVALKKLGLGLIGAVYMCCALIIVLFFACLIGVGLVHVWVEEPVFVRERLYFDYTDAHPSAVFELSTIGGAAGGFGIGAVVTSKKYGVPVGHTFYVSLELLMPESDFNREIGIFQLSAELLSSNGVIIQKSSQPCMLRFTSLPIRLTRTFMMGVPLLLGITSETQKITTQILKHKEKRKPRTELIRVTLIPRAGTSSLPQLYEAEIIMISQLPWRKQIIRNWKWTFYVWATFGTYIFLLLTLLCCFRPLLFPVETLMILKAKRRQRELEMSAKEQKEREVLKNQKKSKKEGFMHMHGTFDQSAGVGSAASSISIGKDDLGLANEEDVGDSESICQ